MMLSGLVAACIYAFTVVLGGILVPGYSHLSQAISEISPLLTGTGRLLVELLFGAYNVLVCVFGILVFGQARSGLDRAMGILLVFVGLAGFSMAFFPMDIIGSPATLRGTVHLILAGLLAPATLALTLLAALGSRDSPRYRVISLLLFAVILVAGPLAAAGAANAWQLTGLLERLAIGSFIVWLGLASLHWKARAAAR